MLADLTVRRSNKQIGGIGSIDRKPAVSAGPVPPLPYENRISRLIETTVDCVLPPLRQLIVEYAVGNRGFTTDGFDTDLAIVEPSDNSCRISTFERSLAWYRFVGGRSIAEDCAAWSVEWTNDRMQPTAGWIGIGVTTSIGNQKTVPRADLELIATDNDWIVYGHVPCGQPTLKIYHASSQVAAIPTGRDDVRKIWFTADRNRGTVRAAWYRDPKTSRASKPDVDRRCAAVDGRDWLQTGVKKLPAFDSIRPVVVLSGNMSAVVRFDPTDLPADRQELIFLICSFG